MGHSDDKRFARRPQRGSALALCGPVKRHHNAHTVDQRQIWKPLKTYCSLFIHPHVTNSVVIWSKHKKPQVQPEVKELHREPTQLLSVWLRTRRLARLYTTSTPFRWESVSSPCSYSLSRFFRVIRDSLSDWLSGKTGQSAVWLNFEHSAVKPSSGALSVGTQ